MIFKKESNEAINEAKALNQDMREIATYYLKK